MKFSIEHAPSYAWVRVALTAGDNIDAEAGAMVSMTPSIEIATRLNAGKRAGFFAKMMAFFQAVGRKFFGGETMFINTFSTQQGGEVLLAPKLSGSVLHQKLDGQRNLFVQQGSYLASNGDVSTIVRWSGLRGFFMGEGVTLLECSGAGDLFLNSYGDVIEIPVDGTYIVDTGHMVAFDGNLNFKIRRAGGMKSFLFSGEGFVCEFSGRGSVWIQSRNLPQTIGWVTKLLP